MMRTPRPFICSKRTRFFTARMNITISIGLMSVPVAIMSTVTTMRGSKLLRNALNEIAGVRGRHFVGDLLAKRRLPRPNSSRTTPTMSSAWLSSLAKMRVFGTSVRPGKISVKRRSRKVRTMGADLVLGHDPAVQFLRVRR